MEPVILIVSITAIISATFLKAKRMNLERDKIRLGLGVVDEPKKKIGFFGKQKEQFVNISSKASKANNGEMDEMKKRMENLETILLDGVESNLMTRESEIQQEMRVLSSRLKDLEK
ncbi:MAG: hypothetical protein ACJAWV_001987 [Flammeovirgaceae bacterium]|jgi:hypothetical protein